MRASFRRSRRIPRPPPRRPSRRPRTVRNHCEPLRTSEPVEPLERSCRAAPRSRARRCSQFLGGLPDAPRGLRPRAAFLAVGDRRLETRHLARRQPVAVARTPSSRPDRPASRPGSGRRSARAAPGPRAAWLGASFTMRSTSSFDRAARAADRDLLLLARRHVLRRHVDDAVGVDVERDLDLRHAARRRRQPDRGGTARACGCRAPAGARPAARAPRRSSGCRPPSRRSRSCATESSCSA